MICLKGGFIHSRHNEIRDLTLECASECFNDVEKEPLLLPLQGESLRLKSANTDPNARLDGRIRGFWCRGQSAFFDNRIFYPDADSYRNKPLEAVYHHHEQEKMRLYDERVVEIEHGSFTPLVMSSTGGLAPLASVFYKRLAKHLAEKRSQPYAQVKGWLSTRLSFSLLRSAILCIRGTRTHRRAVLPLSELSIPLACAEANIGR